MNIKTILVIGTVLVTMHNLKAESLQKKFDREWNSLTLEQKYTAQRIFDYANKDGLGWSAIAIAWQESQFGKWEINLNKNGSMDCGTFQNNVQSVARHQNLKLNRYTKKEICTDLIKDFGYSYLNFAAEIKYWSKVHKGKWINVWSSYNGGWRGNTKYALEIANRILVLKKYIKG